MTRKLLATFIIMIVAGAFLFGTILQIDPEGGFFLQGMISIFLSLFLLVTSFCTLLLFFGKELFIQKTMNTNYFWVCIRRASFISGIVILSLLIARWNMFSIIEFGMILAFFSLLEVIFVFSKKKD